MDLWQSDWFSLINKVNFNISLLHLPMRKSKQTLLSGCHSACPGYAPWLPRIVFQLSFERLWLPGNRSRLPSDIHKSHLILVDSSLLVPLGFSLRGYSPCVATRKRVWPHAWSSGKPYNLSGIEPNGLLWVALRLLASNKKDQPSPPDYLDQGDPPWPV